LFGKQKMADIFAVEEEAGGELSYGVLLKMLAAVEAEMHSKVEFYDTVRAEAQSGGIKQ